jgi:hypothetical protein
MTRVTVASGRRVGGLCGAGGPLTDNRRLAQRADLALPAAVWVLGVVSPPRDGLTPGYLITYSLLLAATALVDQTMPAAASPRWRRLGWLLAEIALCYLVVRTQGTLIRPALLYMLPVGRAILLFGERSGLLASLLVWLAYAINIAPGAWPASLGDFPNYGSFFLAPYAVAAILSVAIVRQERARLHTQSLYDELRIAHEKLQALHQEVRRRSSTCGGPGGSRSTVCRTCVARWPRCVPPPSKSSRWTEPCSDWWPSSRSRLGSPSSSPWSWPSSHRFRPSWRRRCTAPPRRG